MTQKPVFRDGAPNGGVRSEKRPFFVSHPSFCHCCSNLNREMPKMTRVETPGHKSQRTGTATGDES